MGGPKKAVVAYPPYDADWGRLTVGEHTVSVTTHISRHNCFGDVHTAVLSEGLMRPRAAPNGAALVALATKGAE